MKKLITLIAALSLFSFQYGCDRNRDLGTDSDIQRAEDRGDYFEETAVETEEPNLQREEPIEDVRQEEVDRGVPGEVEYDQDTLGDDEIEFND